MNGTLVLLDRVRAMRAELHERPEQSQGRRAHWADRLGTLATDVYVETRPGLSWKDRQLDLLAALELELRTARFRREAEEATSDE